MSAESVTTASEDASAIGWRLTRTGELIQRKREELVFAYRESSLDELVIVSAQFQLESDDPEELTKRMQKQWIAKKAAQPLSHQSAGALWGLWADRKVIENSFTQQPVRTGRGRRRTLAPHPALARTAAGSA